MKRKNENTVGADLYKISPKDIVVVAGFNSRQDFDLDSLVDSIKENGVLNPISVVPFMDEKTGVEKYKLVDGERRVRAVLKAIEQGADIKRIPCLFISKSASNEELLIQQIVRNEGKNFSEYEYGIAYKKLVEIGNYTHKEIAEKLGKPQWHVDCCLKHLDRDKRVQELMIKGEINGVTVRHIYQAHKDDEAGAVAEILGAKKKIDKSNTPKEKKKITLDVLKEVNNNSKTVAVKDTQKIKAGVELLMKYAKPYQSMGVNLNMSQILNGIKQGKLITEIFEDAAYKGGKEAL